MRLSTSRGSALVGLCALLALTHAPQALACGASCPPPNACSCSCSSCEVGFTCACSSICEVGLGCSCGCRLVVGGTPGGSPTAGKLATSTNLSFSLSGSIDLNSLGEFIHDSLGWGVAISGAGTTTVSSGSWDDTIEGVVDSIGTANGFSASWNDSTGVVTLTVS